MNNLLRLNSTVPRLRLVPHSVRLISTEQKKNASAGPTKPDGSVEVPTTFTADEVSKSKNWVYYGWDYHDKKNDRAHMKSAFFLSITCCMVFGGFIYAYQPDRQISDWAQREAYLELRRRERLGLDPIDPWLVDPSTMVLPSDEHLGNEDIII